MVSTCIRLDCPDVAHVLLFAKGGEFDGLILRKGEAVGLCLKHGGEVYDALHFPNSKSKAGRTAPWLVDSMLKGVLPQPWAAHHIRPGTRPNTWNRTTRPIRGTR